MIQHNPKMWHALTIAKLSDIKQLRKLAEQAPTTLLEAWERLEPRLSWAEQEALRPIISHAKHHVSASA